MRQRDDVVTWEYGHDENGNVISAGFEVGETRFEIEHGSREPDSMNRHLFQEIHVHVCKNKVRT